MAQGVDLSLAPKPEIQVEYKTGPRGEHLYGAGGKWYPSVTKILDQWDNGKSAALTVWSRNEALKLAHSELMKFSEPTIENQPAILSLNECQLEDALKAANRRPDDLKEKAGDIGNAVHEAVDQFILSNGKDPDNIPEMAKRGYANFREWHVKSGLVITSPDVPVVNPNLGYGGRLDAMAVGPQGNSVILDWKTSNKIRDQYAAQVAAYRLAATITYAWNYDTCLVVRFDKENMGVEVREVNTYNATQLFYKILDLHKVAKQGKFWIDKQYSKW